MYRCPEFRRWLPVALLAAFPSGAGVALVFFLGANGAHALAAIGGKFWGARWSPHDGAFGIGPLLLGTGATSLLAMLIAIPLGLASALYLALYASARTRRFSDAAIGLLGGIPSVVLGLWGMTWVVPWLGNSLASATLTLGVMIAPTFALLAGASLRQVPARLVETCRALPVSDGATVLVVLRWAAKGLGAAALLALSRAIGESVALSMVAGNIPNPPRSMLAPVATLGTTLIVEFDAATGAHRSALLLLATVATAIVIGIGLLGMRRLPNATP